MRTINTLQIKNLVCELFIKANYRLPDDVFQKIKSAIDNEEKPIAKSILEKQIQLAKQDLDYFELLKIQIEDADKIAEALTRIMNQRG